MFEPSSQSSSPKSKSQIQREDAYKLILEKIRDQKKLSMQEIRIYESMTRESRMKRAGKENGLLPFTVLVHQNGVSYIERVLSANSVSAMRLVESDPRFEERCSVKACYAGHFEHDFNYETEESISLS